ncbi:hypothetical protein [Paraburkholderia sp. BL21I4N1]|uniref:hypothetical protein n=1 Tax=Paraburkholderia sp. BL21I4N1 TaxID=1938801 RepID=UPI000CFD1598|nr:hypothetical protein [Paraburkholderia sp. BL21I4N1]PQV49338.1 hypothetical protein B0G83_107286 [Paraburkholderia sp. BL21I4N1]
MRKDTLHSICGLTGSAVFSFGGLWIASGLATDYASLFDRAGGVLLAVFFIWVACTYVVKLRGDWGSWVRVK